MIPRWELVQYVDGNGVDANGPAPAPFRTIARVPPEKVSILAAEALDFVLVRARLEALDLHRYWDKLRVGGRLIVWAPIAEAFPIPDMLEGQGWDWIAFQEDADSFLSVYRKREDGAQYEAFPDPTPRSVGVVRPGGYGDALFASSIFPHLKRDGYEITVYVERWGEEALRHDPHVARIVANSLLIVGKEDLPAFWAHEQTKHERWINLSATVESTLLFKHDQLEARWPQAVRAQMANVNYLRRIHDVAEVPPVFEQRFYETPQERHMAMSLRDGGPMVAIVDSGSQAQKWWPHAGDLALQLVTARPEVVVVVLGEVRSRIPAHPQIVEVGKERGFRGAAAIAKAADVVVGQDTGIMNATAMEPNRKIVLHAVSTPTNLTQHWVNALSIEPERTPCYPCHIGHKGWNLCARDEASGAALCQANIGRERVLRAVLEAL